MIMLSPLTEYILAYTKPDGSKLARIGIQRWTVRLLPPNILTVFNIGPYFGSYCSIIFAHRWSPSIVPNTILYETTHQGIIYTSGLLGSYSLAEPHNLWLEVTDTNRITTRLMNQSPVAQFFEASDAFLVVQSEPDLAEIRELVKRYSNVTAAEKQLAVTNTRLEEIHRALSIPGVVLAPRPPIIIGGS